MLKPKTSGNVYRIAHKQNTSYVSEPSGIRHLFCNHSQLGKMIEKSIRFWEHIEISKKLDELTLHQEKITSLKTESNTAVPKIQDVQHKKTQGRFFNFDPCGKLYQHSPVSIRYVITIITYKQYTSRKPLPPKYCHKKCMISTPKREIPKQSPVRSSKLCSVHTVRKIKQLQKRVNQNQYYLRNKYFANINFRLFLLTLKKNQHALVKPVQ